MKFNTLFFTLLFLFGLINLFSFITIPQREIFYTLKLISFILLIIVLIVPTSDSKKIFYKSNLSIIITMYIWSLVLTVSLFLSSNNLFDGLIIIIGYILLGFFAFISLPNRYNTAKDYFNINTTWFLSIAIGLLIAIGLSFIGITERYYIDPQYFRLRYTFSFINANFLGMFCYILIMILLKDVVLKEFKHKKTFIKLLLIGLILYILMLSDSRTPLYALVIWCGVFTFLMFTKITRLRIMFYWFLLVGTILFLINISFNLEIIDQLLSFRLTNWIDLIQRMNRLEWIFGKGIGTLATDLGVGTYDNSYISFFVQTGLLGCSALLLLILTIWIKILEIENYKHKTIALATFYSWMAYSLFESAFFSIGNLASIYVWSDLGLLIAIENSKKKDD